MPKTCVKPLATKWAFVLPLDFFTNTHLSVMGFWPFGRGTKSQTFLSFKDFISSLQALYQAEWDSFGSLAISLYCLGMREVSAASARWWHIHMAEYIWPISSSSLVGIGVGDQSIGIDSSWIGSSPLICRLCYRNPPCGRGHWTGAVLIVRRLVRARKHWVPFLLYSFRCCLLFFLSFAPRSPRLSALLVLLFYCRLPCCHLVSLVPSDLRLFRYLTPYASLLTAHCCAYCGRYSPIGSRTLEPALIPLWTPLRSSNHTIYTAPHTVMSL